MVGSTIKIEDEFGTVSMNRILGNHEHLQDMKDVNLVELFMNSKKDKYKKKYIDYMTFCTLLRVS